MAEEIQKESQIWWKKLGGGILRIRDGRKIVKPNEEFLAYPSEIPDGFRDTIVPLEEIPEVIPVSPSFEVKERAEEPVQPLEVDEDAPEYEAVKREKGHWYDVINKETGKPLNDKALTKVQAVELLKAL